MSEDTNVVNESAGEQSTATTDSTTDENNDFEVNDSPNQDESTQETDSDSDDQDQESSGEDDTETDETNEDNQSRPKGADARKEQLNTEIRDLVARKNQLVSQVEQLNAQAYKPASVDELLNQENPNTGEYYNQLEAQLESMRQERELEKYTARVADAQMSIEYEANKALQDFSWADPKSSDYNKEVADTVAKVLAGSLQYDQMTGQLIGSNQSIYQLYESYDAVAKSSARRAEIQGQKNTERMISSADRTSGGQGKPTSFNKLPLNQMEAKLRAKGYDV